MAGKSKLDAATKRRVRAGRLLLAGKTHRKWRARWGRQADGIPLARRAQRGRDRRVARHEQGRATSAAGRGELSRLYVALLEGPERHGFTTPLWTLKRVRLWIEREFGVRYSEVHVWRLLGQLGFSNQKPDGVPWSAMQPPSRTGASAPGRL